LNNGFALHLILRAESHRKKPLGFMIALHVIASQLKIVIAVDATTGSHETTARNVSLIPSLLSKQASNKS